MGRTYFTKNILKVIFLLLVISINLISTKPTNELYEERKECKNAFQIDLSDGKNLGNSIENNNFQYMLTKLLKTKEHKDICLNLSNNNLTIFKLSVFNKLKTEYNIKSINLSDNINLQLITDSDLEEVIELDITATTQYVIPTSGFPNCKILNIANNKITTLNPGDFKNMLSLESIDLEENQIRFINFETFDKLVNLKKLVLSNNPFQIVPENFIAYNKIITDLIIDNHKIPRWRKINSDSLIYLSIRNGALQKLDDDFLEGLLNLQILNISNNTLLRELPTGLLSETLHELDVRSCKLHRLKQFTFCELKNLTKLHLSGNPLTGLNKSFFKNNGQKFQVLDIDEAANSKNVTDDLNAAKSYHYYEVDCPYSSPDTASIIILNVLINKCFNYVLIPILVIYLI